MKIGVEEEMHPKYGLEFSVLVFLVYFVSNAAGVHGLPIYGVVYVPYSLNAPKIDGLWTTPTEWTDANMIRVENMSTEWKFYLGVKYNITHIFVLLDFVSDKTQSTHDFGGVLFDSEDDGGDLARQDDYGFVITLGYPDFTSIFQGNGSGNTTGAAWTQIMIRPYDDLFKGGFSGVNNPYESEAHRIMEFAISRKWFKDAEIHYGFYAFVSDRHSGIPWPLSRRTLLEWPIEAGGKNMESEVWATDVPPAPAKWGDIVFYEDANSLRAAFTELQGNYTKLESECAALLESNSSLQSEVEKMASDYDSLSKRFEDLQTSSFFTMYLVYSLLVISVILAAVIVYREELRRRRNKLKST